MNITENQAKSALGVYASASVELAKEEANLKAEIQALKDARKAKFDRLNKKVRDATVTMKAYAKQQLGAKGGTVQTSFGRFGIRKATYKVVARSGFKMVGTNPEKSVIHLLGNRLPEFLVQEPKLNKMAILGAKHDPDMMNALGECGVRISQSLTFFIEPQHQENAQLSN